MAPEGKFDAAGTDELSRWIGAEPARDAEHKVASLERRLDLALPDDFRAYLLAAAPESDADDPNDICWWSLDRIRSVPEELDARPEAGAIVHALGAEARHYLIFADYMGWAYAWAICCSAGPQRGRVVLICAGVEGAVADSFAEFASLAMTDSPRIHLTDKAPAPHIRKAKAPARPPLPLGKRRITVKEFFLYLPLILLASGAAALLAVWAANTWR